MPVKYKIDVLQALKEAGYTTYIIRKENIFGQATMQKIRQGEIVNAANLGKLCNLLDCQPGDILEYEPEEHTGEGDQADGT